jgi:hypothetical protein
MAQGGIRDLLRGRGFLLMPVAAFAVHQLRFRLAYGAEASQVLAAQGHSYLTSFAPWLVLGLALALGAFVLRVARAAGGRPDGHPRRSYAGLWALSSASLVAIYTAQELVEGLFAAGHPGGWNGVFGHGGWWAVVVAIAAGAVLAALLRIACAVVAVARRLAVRRTRVGLSPLRLRPLLVTLAPWPPLAAAAAGRAPPAA